MASAASSAFEPRGAGFRKAEGGCAARDVTLTSLLSRALGPMGAPRAGFAVEPPVAPPTRLRRLGGVPVRAKSVVELSVEACGEGPGPCVRERPLPASSVRHPARH